MARVRAVLRWIAILWLLVAADAIAVVLRTIAAASANLMPGNIFVSWFVDGKFIAAHGSELTSCCFIPGPQPMRRRRNRDRGPLRFGSLLRRACLPGRTKSAAFAIVEVMALSLLRSRDACRGGTHTDIGILEFSV